MTAGSVINPAVELNPWIQTMLGYRGRPAPLALSFVGNALKQRDSLNEFFSAEEQKAFSVVRLSCDNADDALDIIQDAMLKFVSHYAGKNPSDWKPLFYKIIYRKLTDYQRKRNFRSGIMRLFTSNPQQGYDEIETIASSNPGLDAMLEYTDAVGRLEQALAALPLRQQQAVIMRSWQGFNTQETADIMRLSTGSVKTHYSRGLAKLKQLLGDDWP